MERREDARGLPYWPRDTKSRGFLDFASEINAADHSPASNHLSNKGNEIVDSADLLERLCDLGSVEIAIELEIPTQQLTSWETNSHIVTVRGIVYD